MSSPHVSVEIVKTPIDSNREWQDMQQCAAGDAGAVVCFSGTVRGGDVLALVLEHYPNMTEKSLHNIATDAANQFPVYAARIVHRVGRMLPGEMIVFAAAAAAHRQDAFSACAYMMDYLKTRAPFWKKEETKNGMRWVEARDSDEQSRAAWDSANRNKN